MKMKILKNILLFLNPLSVMANEGASHAQTVTFKGEPVSIEGKFPQIGDLAPSFVLVNNDLKDITLTDFEKKRKVLNIYISIDTPVCDSSVRKFNEMVASLPNTVMIGISNDLPFAQKRFCGAANIENVTTLSAFRSPEFAKNYGVDIAAGPLKGLTARAIIILDENNKVIYSQRSKEMTENPDYEKVIEALK